MPKNNSKERKAWRKALADFNAAFWAGVEGSHDLLFSKPYSSEVRDASRGERP